MFTYTSAIRGFHKFHISGQRLSTATKTEVYIFLETYKKSKKKKLFGDEDNSPETKTGIPVFWC